MAWPALWNFANGQTIDMAKFEAELASIRAHGGTLVNADCAAGMALDPHKIAPTFAGNVDGYEDLNDLLNSMATIINNQLGEHSAWNSMLAVEGISPIVVTGVAGNKVTVAAGGRVAFLGHDFTTLEAANLGFHTGGLNNRAYTEPECDALTIMEPDSVYALRLCSGAPPISPTSAQFNEAGQPALSAHWELVKTTTGRFYRGSVDSVATSATGLVAPLTIGISSAAGDVMGARVRVISPDTSPAIGREFTVPWTNGSSILFPNTLSGVPDVGDIVLINSDHLLKRINSVTVTGEGTSGDPYVYRQAQDGPSIPQDALVAIIVTHGAGTTPSVVRMPVNGGFYNGGRSLITESDWTSGSTNAVPTSVYFNRPFDGCRIKAVWGLTALHNSLNGMVILRPLASICPSERSYEQPAGATALAGWWQSGFGIEIGIHQDSITVSCFQEGFANNAWPGGQHDGAGMAANSYSYNGIKVKVFVEFAP